MCDRRNRRGASGVSTRSNHSERKPTMTAIRIHENDRNAVAAGARCAGTAAGGEMICCRRPRRGVRRRCGTRRPLPRATRTSRCIPRCRRRSSIRSSSTASSRSRGRRATTRSRFACRPTGPTCSRSMSAATTAARLPFQARGHRTDRGRCPRRRRQRADRRGQRGLHGHHSDDDRRRRRERQPGRRLRSGNPDWLCRR